MNPAQKALWYIESHLAEDLSLDQVAAIAGVSRYHMVRAFGVATGLSVMRYVRARRLSEAARSLANGASNILAVALSAEYGSHEAFTRAFGEQFGITPEALRAKGSLDTLTLLEPVMMDSTKADTLQAPRFESGRPLLIAGLGERYGCGASAAGIPGQWQRFMPHIGHVPGQIGSVAYGVVHNGDDAGNFDYIAGVEVKDFSDVPVELSRLRIPEQHYAVFTHRDHISGIRKTMHAIWNDWLPASGRKAADGPMFERYDERFNPRTGDGGLEVWLPVEK